MELAAHRHRCQNLSKKQVTTSLLYRACDDPVKDGLLTVSTNDWVPDGLRVGTGAVEMGGGGACAVLAHHRPFPFSTR